VSKKAIILLSGGLDSATTLAIATSQLVAAKKIAKLFKVKDFKVVNLDLSWLNSSALINNAIKIPESSSTGIPVTYVPARNTILMSLALAWAENLDCGNIFIGVNAVDYSGYPDCRQEYIDSFQKMVNLATKSGVEGSEIKIHTPLINLSKADIVTKGTKLGVDYSKTISCYQPTPTGLSCAKCDSCRLRKIGFQDAGIIDPTSYVI
jgi:7-cyano-7-deazaguanine synthase